MIAPRPTRPLCAECQLRNTDASEASARRRFCPCGLAAAIPPFATIPFELHAERAGLLGEAWRLRAESPQGLLERIAAAIVRRPALGAVAGLGAVVVLTAIALLVGPPGS